MYHFHIRLNEPDHVENVNIRIFCDEVVSKEKNKIGIGCIAGKNTITAKILKVFYQKFFTYCKSTCNFFLFFW